MSGVSSASIIGGNPAHGRNPADFYPTPAECTSALIKSESDRLGSFDRIWEPAAGDGAICRVLEEEGIKTVATDLHSYDYAISGIDFLAEKERRADAIITNPPFNLAADFIVKAHDLGVEYIALFLKSAFWHAKRRTKLFADHPPAKIYALNWRPQFKPGAGSPTMDFIWCVWDQRSAPETRYLIMGKT